MLNDFMVANPRAGALVMLLLRVLAVLDALLVPGAILWWFAKQSKGGGPFGMTAAALLSIWAAKRIWKALFALDEYDWMVAKLGKWVLLFGVFGLVAKLWWLATH